MSSKSHVKGADAPALLRQTIGEALSNAAVKYGDHEALISAHQNVRLSYRQLCEQAEVLAANLLSLGLHTGDRIGIWAPNCVEWALTQFAAAKAGLILVNINPAYRLYELEYALNKVECRALVLAESFKTSKYFEMIQALAPELESNTAGKLKSAKLPHLQYVIGFGAAAPAGFVDFNDLTKTASGDARQKLAAIEKSLSPDDAMNIQFTSGTTGSPKGATLTHANILNNGFFVGAAMELEPKDRICIPVPLYHCFGMVMGNLGCLTHGATMIYPAPAFDPESVLKTVEEEKCTVLYGVPTMFVAELAAPDFGKYDLTTLRTGIMAGAPCPTEVMKQVVADMHMKDVTIAYGMTETSPVSFQSSIDDPIERRVSTVGRVLPHLEVKVVDEGGVTVPRGEKGELCTKGYSVMLGYWNDPERTAESLVDGWMHTGDLATIDNEGYGNIVGRVKDMVIRGGENLYPREIEEFLYTHDDIVEVAVFGVPDDKYGEELCAWIQTQDGVSLTEAQIKEFCQGKIAHFKIPRYVRFVDEFPMTVTGKIQKFQMRDAMCEELSLEARESA
jgi:fatty-acyl-CoA synthase